MSDTSFFRVVISESSIDMSPSSFTFRAVRSSFSLVATLIESSVLSITDKQYSFFSYSAACSFFRSAIILSIISLTFVKESSRMRTASDASIQLPCFFAVRITRCIALFIILLFALSATAWPSICKKLNVLPKSARASSPMRIFSVSERATISSSRALTRLANSSSAVLQFSSNVNKNFSSAVREFVVDSISSLAVASVATASANLALFESTCDSAAAISANFDAFRSLNIFKAAASVALASARSLSNSSSISFRRP
mmetsp:Transcript_76589/g.144290  ORF Transcript_76589/g.144290 Transcript_76589/m.144290 type:complete len:257 (-) Transcript_76589:838-1608(-)